MGADDDGVVDCDCCIRPRQGKYVSSLSMWLLVETGQCCFSINIQLATVMDGKTNIYEWLSQTIECND